ncbi:S8 family peptidase [Candidatus Uabimicrobium amorphum]|uniref:Subtilase n=1 Tax=Uabimicrobium amorphum TaxID=2596890 RepID=A0A5S9F3P1_UABAM|nr:S8/S53 family peptidase [Candidatus Uabimicrobium amorphum]BBM84937.1 subtilase [Candidatus Uabimicrobium amorphum]
MYKILFCLVFIISFVGAEEILIKIKADGVSSFTKKEIRAGEISFKIRPLTNKRSRFAKNWFIATSNERSDKSSWDLAHQLVEENDDVIYGEPNSPKMNDKYRELARSLKKEHAQNDTRGYNDTWSYPDPDVFGWHLQDSHGQLKRARREAAYKSGRRIRIAHFDTGYDPKANITTPESLRLDLQKNFVKGEDENLAADPGTDGLIDQPGHGTSTMSVLAGNRVDLPDKKYNDYLGGAPEADIVPVRLSTTVLLFQVDVFAKGLYYAIESDCDVVSMSMGGVASKLWAEAVNDAYNNGVVVVTAAGNNVAQLPTHYLVYPAKFKRVIAVCGVGYDHNPYFKDDKWFVEMQGNWGPKELMGSAIAAYTPNTPAGKLGKGNHIGNGGGTSAATPQIAATAALWLHKYRDFKYEHKWQRVNAVRHALFSTARKDLPNSEKYYGNGVYRAADALKVAPKIDSKPVPEDEVYLPYLSLFFGWETLEQTTDNKDMITIEMAQLEQSNPELRKLLEELRGKTSITKEQKEAIRAELKKIPETSQTLLDAIK